MLPELEVLTSSSSLTGLVVFAAMLTLVSSLRVGVLIFAGMVHSTSSSKIGVIVCADMASHKDEGSDISESIVSMEQM